MIGFFLCVVDFAFYCVLHTEIGKTKGLQGPLKVSDKKYQMFLCRVLTTEGEVPQWSGTMLFRRKIKVNNDACFICKMNILYNFSSNISFICWEKKKLFCKILITVLTVTGQPIYPIMREFYLPQKERNGLREREQRPNLSAGKLPYKLQQ